MSLTVSVRVEYVNAKKFSFQQRHDRRELKKPHYINPELSHLNECALDKGFSGKELLELNRGAVRQKAVEEGRCPLKHPKKIKKRCRHSL